jgi:hypothetical protein
VPITPPITVAPLGYTAFDVITDALIECGILSPGESANLDPDTGQWAFRKLNYLIDIWQAKAGFVYSENFQAFSVPQVGLSPYLIGPDTTSAHLVTSTVGGQGVPRPVRIESATFLLNTTGTQGPVDLPITIRDRVWWAAQQVKAIQTNVITDLYYDPTWPNGSCYFWPVPNAAFQVRLQLWNVLNSYVQINDPLLGAGLTNTLPQAYRAALMLTLAESLLPSGAIEAHPVLVKAAQEARIALFGNNAKSPRISTQDSGMPRAGARAGTRADFNWATGGAPGGAPE